MHHAKPTRKGSKYNADNQAASIDPTHYPFIRFPADAPVQPGDRVEYMDEDERLLTGSVLEDGSYLLNNVLYVRVDFDECIDAVVATSLTKVFDYEVLDAETRIVVQQKTGEIKTLMRRAAQDIIDIGTKLIEVKAKLEYGSFGKWLDAEFGWTDRTARNFMHVATAFKTENFSDLKFGPSALYLLAAPSTPEEARQEAVERATSGDVITHATAKTIVAQHKGEPPVKPAPQPDPISIARAHQQAIQVLPPVTRPPSVTYTKSEDDYQDDVPSVDVNDTHMTIDDFHVGDKVDSIWGPQNGTVTGFDLGRVVVDFPDQPDFFAAPYQLLLVKSTDADEKTGFKIGDKVEAAGHFDGEIIELDPVMGALVKFPNHTPWWLSLKALRPMEQKAEAAAPTAESFVFKVGDKVETTMGRKGGVVEAVDPQNIHNKHVLAKFPGTQSAWWIEAESLVLVERPEPAAAASYAHHLSGSNEWYTPKQYVAATRDLMAGIDLDPASCAYANKTVQARQYYDIEVNGLSKIWKGSVFLNPPYGFDEDGDSNVAVWTARLVYEFQNKNVTEAVLLVNATTERKWFQPLWQFPICFTDHRINFYNADGEQKQPTQGNAFVYFGEHVLTFANMFAKFGTIVKKV